MEGMFSAVKWTLQGFVSYMYIDQPFAGFFFFPIMFCKDCVPVTRLLFLSWHVH